MFQIKILGSKEVLLDELLLDLLMILDPVHFGFNKLSSLTGMFQNKNFERYFVSWRKEFSEKLSRTKFPYFFQYNMNL